MLVWEQDRSQVPLPKEMLTELPGCVSGGGPRLQGCPRPLPSSSATERGWGSKPGHRWELPPSLHQVLATLNTKFKH